MIIAKNDEEKRSKIWAGVTIVSSVLILLTAVFLLTKLFTANPLEGAWEDEDGRFRLFIGADDSLLVGIPELTDDNNLEVKLDYMMDKGEKTITVKVINSEIDKLVKQYDGTLTRETLERAVGSVATTFDYSVDKNKLTLTEREYGEQMIFIKK